MKFKKKKNKANYKTNSSTFFFYFILKLSEINHVQKIFMKFYNDESTYCILLLILSIFILLNYYKFKRLLLVNVKDTLLMPIPGLFERERSIYYLTSSIGARVLLIILRLAISGLGDLIGSFVIFLDRVYLIGKVIKKIDL